MTWARGPRIDARPAVLVEVAALGAFLVAVAALVFAPRAEVLARIPVFPSFLLFSR